MVDLSKLWRLSNYDIRTGFEKLNEGHKFLFNKQVELEIKIRELEKRITELEKDG